MSESSPRTIVPADIDNNIEAVAAVDAGARAEALSWAPNTRKAYIAGWNDFTRWCIENRCPGLPSEPADVGRYLEHLMEMEGKSLATARLRLAAIAGAHRLRGHTDPTSLPLVKATLKRLARDHSKARRQARGLNEEALGPSERRRGSRGSTRASAGARRRRPRPRGGPWWTWPSCR